MYLRVTNLHLENCHYPYRVGVGGTGPLTPGTPWNEKEREKKREEGREEKERGSGRSRREMSPTPGTNRGFEVGYL